MLRILLSLLKMATVAALAALVLLGAARFFQFVTDAAKPDDLGKRIQITISEDEDEGELASLLREAGLIKSEMLFRTQLRFGGGSLMPGTYTIVKGMSQPEIIAMISGEQVVVAEAPSEPESFPITVPEGYRIEQIAELYEEKGGEGGFDAFMDAVATVDRSQFDFLADLPAEAPLEGYLFPDTYTFSAVDPMANVVAMLTNFGNRLDPEMRARAVTAGMSIQQVVIFASLVEREAVIPPERPIIADVYLSRWQQGWRLDADPTVQYVLGQRGEWWPKLTGEDLFAASPYNMYQNDGIPPAPICNPGLASLQAVLWPAETDYMYFVAKGDIGEHAFAVTYEEQQANVDAYLNNPGE
ncbi:MAG: endolytic transglycosylase MltG [Chloroflexota bacterium]